MSAAGLGPLLATAVHLRQHPHGEDRENAFRRTESCGAPLKQRWCYRACTYPPEPACSGWNPLRPLGSPNQSEANPPVSTRASIASAELTVAEFESGF